MKKYLFSNKLFNFIQFIILFYTVYLFSGFYFVGSNYLTLSIFFLVLILLLIFNFSITIHFLKNNILLIMFLFYLFISSYIGSNLYQASKITFYYFLSFIPPLLFSYFKYSRAFIKLLFFFFFVLNFLIIFYYIENPGIARLMASFPERFYFQFKGTGYSYSYFLVLLSVILTNNYSVFSNKTFIFLFLFTNLTVVFLTYSTITTLVLFLALIIIFLSKKVKLNNKIHNQPFYYFFKVSFYIISASVFFITAHLIFGIYLIALVEDLRFNSVFWTRIYELSLFVFDSSNLSTGASINLRIEYFLSTLKTFLNFPLFGVAYRYGLIFENSYDFGVGSHNEWFDNLANFGFLFGFILNFSYFYLLNKLNKFVNINDKFVYFVPLFLLGLLNPILSIPFVYGNIFVSSLIINFIKDENSNISRHDSK
jgi:hypothetical protein